MLRKPFKSARIDHQKSFDVGGDLVDAVVEGVHKVIDWFSGTAMPPKIQNFLKAHGEEKITSLKVGRTPISKYLDLVLDAMSAGKYNQVKKKLAYDKFFHLYVIINDKYVLEKNELFNQRSYSPDSEEQTININIGRDTDINEFLKRASEGDEKSFYRDYDAFGDNCQKMVIRLLSKNGFLSPEVRKFVLQDLGSVVKEIEPTAERAKNITNVASLLNRLLQIGSGGKYSFAKGTAELITEA